MKINDLIINKDKIYNRIYDNSYELDDIIKPLNFRR